MYHITAPFAACQYKLKFARVPVVPGNYRHAANTGVKQYFQALMGIFLFQCIRDVVPTTMLMLFLHTFDKWS